MIEVFGFENDYCKLLLKNLNVQSDAFEQFLESKSSYTGQTAEEESLIALLMQARAMVKIGRRMKAIKTSKLNQYTCDIGTSSHSQWNR
jgi:hypothetical protein